MADREKEVIVTREGGGGGTIIAVILLLIVAGALFFFFSGNFLNGDKTTDINVDAKIDTPAPDAK